MQEKTLVIMAAGMGSRFGGFKQIEPVGPNDEFIIDYSVYDAKKAGFTKVIFIIKKELERAFKETIGKRLENEIKVEYAYQELENIPESKKYLLEKRQKPWGTVHAVLSAKDIIDSNFVVMNADDFYGFGALRLASEFLDNSKEESVQACITYPVEATSSKFGSVKRGICFGDDVNINEIVESKVEIKDGLGYATPLDGKEPFTISLTQPVSMNLFAFKKGFLKSFEEYTNEYFEQPDEYILEQEILIPELVKVKLQNGEITLKNIVSDSKWLGMTYKEDLEEVKKEIKRLIDIGEYPNQLWHN